MSNYDVTFADVIHTETLNFWISQFFTSFFKELFKGSWKLKKFFQYLKYKLRYDILNLDKFGAQKRGTPL